MLRKLFFLLILFTNLFYLSCQSPTNKLVSEVDDLCVGSFESTGGTLEVPPELLVHDGDTISYKNKIWILTSKYRDAIRHSQDLATCAKARECLLKNIQYKYFCEREFVQNINSWIPFALQGRGSCSAEKPDCKVKY